jgi:hypothetical protein
VGTLDVEYSAVLAGMRIDSLLLTDWLLGVNCGSRMQKKFAHLVHR